ncbi:expressed protein [Phakopsora pachyrhizi]|uniref:Expressed protein n=1 Tax=Phakopsora pachyrhizi TaxID=170000 RepID=A0AAV0AFG8_PHAPC|nr:expressed protein [Phakopsora pachyrhizi]
MSHHAHNHRKRKRSDEKNSIGSVEMIRTKSAKTIQTIHQGTESESNETDLNRSQMDVRRGMVLTKGNSTSVSSSTSSSDHRSVSSKPNPNDSNRTSSPSTSFQPDIDPILITRQSIKNLNQSLPCLSIKCLVGLVGLTQSEILSSRYISTTQLNALCKNFGLKFSSGKFNELERARIEELSEEYCKRHGLSRQELSELIMSKRGDPKNSQNNLNCSSAAFSSLRRIELATEIARELRGRPLISVWHHLKRLYNPKSRMGRWKDDDDQDLLKLHNENGGSWTLISQGIGRSATDCRDRWRDFVSLRGKRRSGHWSSQEEMTLINILEKAINQDFSKPLREGKIFKCDGLWNWASKQMGGRRSRIQCREKGIHLIETRLNWNRTDDSKKFVFSRQNDKQVVWRNRDTLILAQQLMKQYGIIKAQKGLRSEKEDLEIFEDLNFADLLFKGWDGFHPDFLNLRWKKLKRKTRKSYFKNIKKKEGCKKDKVKSSEAVEKEKEGEDEDEDVRGTVEAVESNDDKNSLSTFKVLNIIINRWKRQDESRLNRISRW